ncbi:MAG TPA: NAD(P)H-flavin reductase [Rheinheimera sp.]|nr:NAD(P)H-flavin reductase [Rheinheimera sp.]
MSIVKLSNSKVFSCGAEQTLLEAARAQGILLEHGCRTGRCGICKAKVVTGTTSVLLDEGSLSQDERDREIILTCCRAAVTDVELDIEDLSELAGFSVKTLPCRIDGLQMLSEDVLDVTLRLPPNSSLQYLPGQYVDIIKGSVRRSYSVANAPRDDGKITMQIRRVANGEMSRYWFDEAKENDLLRLEGALGTFFLRQESARHLIFLATGTGIAPIKAILQQLASSKGLGSYENIHLYWGGRCERDMYWVPDFPGLNLNYVQVLSRSASSTGRMGYVQDAVIDSGIALEAAVVYACGSEKMIESARETLIASGLEPKRFHSDAFVSSN